MPEVVVIFAENEVKWHEYACHISGIFLVVVVCCGFVCCCCVCSACCFVVALLVFVVVPQPAAYGTNIPRTAQENNRKKV